MISKEILSSLVNNFQKDLELKNTISRDVFPKILPKYATVISGIRRCGKSVLSKQMLGIKSPIYYFHFENIQLASFELKDFSRLDECFIEQLGKDGIYLLDEIQNVKGWEIYVRQLVDSGKSVVITGSNATMLSRELGTRLTGRNLRYELYPFSFAEFLRLVNKNASLKEFDKYFEKGGFPDYVLSEESEILENLFQDIFYRDILVRNDIRRESELKQFVSYISSNVGVEVSFLKLKKLLSLGSHNTISQFLLACEQAYLFFSINRFDYSLKKQSINPKKVYCVDNGLLKLNSFNFSENKGRYLENLVFMSLKRNKKEVYYHKIEKECDFVIKKGEKIVEAIQVCYNLDDQNSNREYDGLLEAINKYKLKYGLLLTYNQEDEIEYNGKKIIIKPVWKWLLES